MDSKKQAQGIASLGRYGDTTLMHMRPDEVAQLTAISRANGGDITINPKTGMPEAFLGDFFSAMAPTIAGAALMSTGIGGAYAPYLAAGAGGLTAYAQGKRDPLSIGMGALGGYGGGQMVGNLPGGAAPTPTDAAGATPAIEPGTTATAVYSPQGAESVSMFTPQGQGVAQGFGQSVNMAEPSMTFATRSADAFQTPRPVFEQQSLGPISNAPRPDFSVAPTGGFDGTTTGGLISNAADNISSGIQTGAQNIMGNLKKTGEGIKELFTKEGAMDDYILRQGGRRVDPVTGEVIEEGSKLAGYVKTGLPFAGAGYEAYMKDVYAGIPKYEDSAGMYDPTRKLNLGMDTGLRLLAEGGEVKKYQLGGPVADQYNADQLAKLAAYGVVPQYQEPPRDYYGMARPNVNYRTEAYRMPVMGSVDVGGKFVADPKGDITDVQYTDKYKYILEGPAKQDQDSGGDMDTINQGAQSGMSVNPAAALNLAQGYADAQQSDTAETGLGGLKKGGAIKYQQGGQTTAETNTAKTSTPPPATTMDMMVAKKNEEEMAKQGIPAGINMEAIKKQAGMNEGGLAGLTPEGGKMLNGMGDGVSDDIPAVIEGEQEAALSDGEFIIPARIVSELGNGSSDAGAEKLYSMIDRIQALRSKTIGDDKEYAKDTNAERFLPI